MVTVIKNSSATNEGIYFFGGRDANYVASDKLWLLKVYQNPAEFVLLEPSGKKPVARYGHSLTHIENSPYLVLFGGRNDNFFKIFTYKTCFAFLDLLDIEKNTWIKVSLGSYKPQSRYSFCSAMHGSRLLVFGGLTDLNYLPAQMERLEFDSIKVDQIIKLENKAKSSLSRQKTIIDPDIMLEKEIQGKNNEFVDEKTPDLKSFMARRAEGLLRKRPSEQTRENSQKELTHEKNSVSSNQPHLKNSYQPVPKSVKQVMRHVHGSSLHIKPGLF